MHQYGIMVSISANDGTRLYTPTAVGPDGGSTPTDAGALRAPGDHHRRRRDSTTPSRVQDSGAIAAGGTTPDDTLVHRHRRTRRPSRRPGSAGSGDFSSGFGSRIDLSAPSDNIPAFYHAEGGRAERRRQPDRRHVRLGPEIAAAAAVVSTARRS